jgi:hypothetical protein
MSTPYYAIKSLYAPGIITSAVSGKTYAVAGSTWVEITPDVTVKMLRDAWTPLVTRAKIPDATIKEYEVISENSGKVYSVSQNGSYWSCSCPAFGFRHKCKHIESVKTKMK